MTTQSSTNHKPPFWKDAGALPQVAIVMVIAASGWYLLNQLAPILRPLLMAVLLAFVVLPTKLAVQHWVHGLKGWAILAVAVAGLVAGLAFLFSYSISEMSHQIPQLEERAKTLAIKGRAAIESRFPEATPFLDGLSKAESRGEAVLRENASSILKIATDITIEALVVGLFLLFLLAEASRLPKRVKSAFTEERSKRILEASARIALGISGYLKAKVLSSLILSIPVTLVLWLFGVKFAMFWGLLTFGCNFIPYVGTAVGLGLPLLFGLVDLDFGWQPIVMSILLVLIHVSSSSFVEPVLIGKAVGLRPLVILISLSFWGLCWGVVGMFLAIPLTVAGKIVLENIEATQPIAKLLGDE